MPLEGFRIDLESVWPKLTELRHRLADAGFLVTQLRILEVLVWMWADPLRQYLKLLDGENHES